MKPIPDPPKTLEECRPRFMFLIGELIEVLELRKNLDIRERVTALALIERVLYREKPDEPDRGSKVKQYAANFRQKANGEGGAGRGDAGSAGDSPAAGGEPQSDDDDSASDHPDA